MRGRLFRHKSLLSGLPKVPMEGCSPQNIGGNKEDHHRLEDTAEGLRPRSMSLGQVSAFGAFIETTGHLLKT